MSVEVIHIYGEKLEFFQKRGKFINLYNEDNEYLGRIVEAWLHPDGNKIYYIGVDGLKRSYVTVSSWCV
jgi:hypothetical protein